MHRHILANVCSNDQHMRFIGLVFRYSGVAAAAVFALMFLASKWQTPLEKLQDEFHLMARTGHSDTLSRYDLICFITGERPFDRSTSPDKLGCEPKEGKAAFVEHEPNVARVGLVTGTRTECIRAPSAFRAYADVCSPPSHLRLRSVYSLAGPTDSNREFLYLEVTLRE